MAISPILFEYGTPSWNFHSNQRTKTMTSLRNLKYYLREQRLSQKRQALEREKRITTVYNDQNNRNVIDFLRSLTYSISI